MEPERLPITLYPGIKNPLPPSARSGGSLRLPPSTKQRPFIFYSVQAGTSKGKQRLKGGGEDYLSVQHEPIPTSFVDCISSFPTTTAVLSNFQGAFIPYITAGDPDLPTIAEALKVLDACGSDIIELGVPYFDPLADGPFIQAAATRSLGRGTNSNKILAMLKEFDSIPSLTTFTAMLSNSQGKCEDTLTLLRKVLLQAMPATGKGEFKGKHTKLIKEFLQTMSAFDLCYATWKVLQAMSATKKAGASNGNGRLNGEGEDEDPRSLPKEELKDDELLIPIQRAEEREHNCAFPQREEEREHNCALPQRAEKKWSEGLGSVVPHVISVGMCALTYIGVCRLYKNEGKKVDDLALRLKAVNEALGAVGCPPPTVLNIMIGSLFTLFNFGNPSTTASPPAGLFNFGNPSTTASSLSGLINIGQFKIGK